MFRQLLDDPDRRPLPSPGGWAGRSVADNELKELFHHDNTTRIMWFVTSACIESFKSCRVNEIT